MLAALPALSWADSITLGNDEWPPFILDGSVEGKSEQLVCQALQRAGHECRVDVQDWDDVLQAAKSGEIDGIAAVWRNPAREAYLLFSEPYLTNRIVPVLPRDAKLRIATPADLQGLRVALVENYAYGEDIERARADFQPVPTRNSAEALQEVSRGAADVALVDELVARTQLGGPGEHGLVASSDVLAFRSLHFAVSKAMPNATQLLDDFHRAYQMMLLDGAVNDILEVDWLATDFGQPGNMAVVMRSGVSLEDLDDPNASGGMYALDSAEYEWMSKRSRSVDDSRVKYQVGGKSYSNLNTALTSAFGKDAVCKHNDYSSTFDCTDLFKK